MCRDLLLNLITKLKYLVRAFQGLRNLQKYLEYSWEIVCICMFDLYWALSLLLKIKIKTIAIVSVSEYEYIFMGFINGL